MARSRPRIYPDCPQRVRRTFTEAEPMTVSPVDGSRDETLCFVVEKLRLRGYAGFWVVVLTGIVLTRYFSGLDMESTLLHEVFGYNNICVFFDYPPSNYVLPFLWAITLVLLLMYVTAHWLHMRAEVQQGTLSVALYRTLSGLKVFEAFTLIAFSTIFAVSPEGWNRTLYIHTAPFFLLQLGMVSLAMSNTLHGVRSGYWRRLEMPEWFVKGAIAYCVVFALIVAFKIPVATNAMAHYRWWAQTDTLATVAGLVDKGFLICAAIIPMMKAAYLVYLRSDDLDVVHLAPSIASHPFGRHAHERA
jgi:hypothetical protein